MDLKEALSYWKSIIGSLVVIVGGIFAAIAWAEDAKEAAQQAATIAAATQQLIHNDMYQESRIDRKKDQIIEDKRELDNILEDVGEATPTPRQARSIQKLDKAISAREKDIEVIEVKLKTEDE